MHRAHNTPNWVLNMSGIGALERLLKLEDTDELEIAGEPEPVSYRAFKEEILPRVEAIYTDTAHYLEREAELPVGMRVPSRLVGESQKSE